MAAMTPNKKIRNSDLETEIGLGQAAETTREKKMQINETEKSFAKAEEEHRRITSQSEAEVLKSLSDAKKQNASKLDKRKVTADDPFNEQRILDPYQLILKANPTGNVLDGIDNIDEEDIESQISSSANSSEIPDSLNDPKETATVQEDNRKIYRHFDKVQIKNELQDILVDMINQKQGTTSLDIIRNNAATFGTVIGSEYSFWEQADKK